MADDTLERIEYLSLVSKISTELLNHTGMGDKVLAEFIINVHGKSKNVESFKSKLTASGAEFKPEFVETLDRLITTMRPKSMAKKSKKRKAGDTASGEAGETKKSKNEWEDDETAEQRMMNAAKFPGLAVRNDYQKAQEMAAVDAKVAADTMDDLDQLLRGKKEEANARDRESDRHRGGDRDSYGRDRDRDRDGDRDRDRGRGHHGRSRSRSRSPRGRRGGGKPQIDDAPVLYKIYNGKVTNMREFGAFVHLEGVRGRCEGMVHISSLSAGPGRIAHPQDVVSRNQSVKVKVMSVAGNRIGLSMKDVDQETGKDLSPNLRVKSKEEMEAESTRNPERPIMTSFSEAPIRDDGIDTRGSSVKRISSPERWEIKQLIASGVLNPRDYPTFDEDVGLMNYEENEEELDIEIKEEEPLFLKGQTRNSVQLSPVKIVKNPDGTLNRAALQGASLAKERREIRSQQAAAEFDAVPKDLNRPWVDPMAAPGERVFSQDLRGIGQMEPNIPEWKKKTFGAATTFGKITSLSIKEQRESLPIFKLRNQLVKAVEDNQVLIVVGDTGSGKTTQMTQYLAEEGFTSRGMIGCTQPRRVAAMSVAKRVAEEVGCRLGQEVGYTIRFEDCSSSETKIKYMTDGMLLREILVDPTLSRYSVLILDEAHERTMSTDVLFGLLKDTVKKRADLKLIVTSATLDAEKFSTYFFNCPIFTIPGRTFPVEILFSKEPESDYMDSAMITVLQIHLSEPPGDILLFLTGQEEIDTAAEVLFERMKALGPQVPELLILPVYSALPSEMQSKIFDPAPPGSRKVVIATNIAETSITIDGIYYVVDPGFVKQNTYDPKLGMDALVVVPISQAQARQRSGRAGRTGPGKCYRLYTESAYQNEMLPNSIPEIQRMNLSDTVLKLKAMGINDLLNFPFMDPPPVQTMITAMELLFQLGALDSEGLITRLGRKMSEFPLEPSLSKMLILSVDLGCSDEVLSIVAMLSVQNIFYRPKEKQALADQKKAKFHQPEGDHLTLLTVYNGWKVSKFSNPWCYENFIQARSMRRAQDIRKQMLGIMDRYRQDIVSCGKNYNKVRRAICGGFFRHSAKKDPQEGYKTMVEGTPVYIHPSSALFNKQPEWVIYHELVMTTKEYMREVISIEPKWLVEVAPNFFKVADSNKISKRKRQEKLEPLYNRFEKPNEWRISKVQPYNVWSAALHLKIDTSWSFPQLCMETGKYLYKLLPESVSNILIQLTPFYLAAALLQTVLPIQDVYVSSALLCVFPVLQFIETICILMFTQDDYAGVEMLSTYELVTSITFSVPSKVVRLVYLQAKLNVPYWIGIFALQSAEKVIPRYIAFIIYNRKRKEEQKDGISQRSIVRSELGLDIDDVRAKDPGNDGFEVPTTYTKATATLGQASDRLATEADNLSTLIEVKVDQESFTTGMVASKHAALQKSILTSNPNRDVNLPRKKLTIKIKPEEENQSDTSLTVEETTIRAKVSDAISKDDSERAESLSRIETMSFTKSTVYRPLSRSGTQKSSVRAFETQSTTPWNESNDAVMAERKPSSRLLAMPSNVQLKKSYSDAGIQEAQVKHDTVRSRSEEDMSTTFSKSNTMSPKSTARISPDSDLKASRKKFPSSKLGSKMSLKRKDTKAVSEVISRVTTTIKRLSETRSLKYAYHRRDLASVEYLSIIIACLILLIYPAQFAIQDRISVGKAAGLSLGVAVILEILILMVESNYGA
ncbi:DEAH-box ATP-dependent RNA helicase prp22 [Phlyctochytrium planicorne]|nr:DEAH-box ATP-dependent RNA helicase prp22 [Phlyctochytrium planicorne]